MTISVSLEPVESTNMPAFKQRLQTAFTMSAHDEFPDFPEVIPPTRDIDESLNAMGAEALEIKLDDASVGGAIVSGDGVDMLLDFLFIDPEFQNKHLGSAAWTALEKRYPTAKHWELVTPYFEKRNIHFYVNRCDFHITEYFNEYHEDPNYPQEEGADYPDEDDGLFKFEKWIERE